MLDTLTKSAAQLCAADLGLIFQQDGDVLRLVANFGVSREAERYWLEHPVGRWPGERDRACPIGRQGNPYSGRAGRSRIPIDPRSGIGWTRSTLSVPLLRDGTTIGIFALSRREVNPFTDKQIELVTTFADQAVIAIENARLLNELRQRTDELGRSVGELRALGEVSQAVNSTLDLETVLSTIVAKAVQLSGTEAGAIYVFDDAATRISSACHLRHGSGVN